MAAFFAAFGFMFGLFAGAFISHELFFPVLLGGIPIGFIYGFIKDFK